MLRHLIDGRSRIQIERARGEHEGTDVEGRRKVVNDRVSEQHREGLAAVLLEEPREPSIDLGEGLLPGRFLELTISADQRRPQPVGVMVEFAQGGSLGADETAAEGILFVASNPDHPVALDLDRNPASRLA